MRWALLGIAVGGFLSFLGLDHGYALLAAFIVMFTNFATFCVLYDRPKDRARSRVAGLLGRLQPNSDIAQRMATAPIATTAADRHLGVGPLTVLNLATGIAASCLLLWGLLIRIF